jgi:hypothetical protein
MAHMAVEILDRYWDRLEICGISTDGIAYVTLHVVVSRRLDGRDRVGVQI